MGGGGVVDNAATGILGTDKIYIMTIILYDITKITKLNYCLHDYMYLYTRIVLFTK